jgi:membrane protein DedA with SNARE-associated domain/rhodanese-related sulfurtransferase
MELDEITRALQQAPVWIVFLSVLLERIGLPLPAAPVLLLAGSLAANMSALGELLAVAIAASVLGDWLWYWAGTVFGYKVLAGLCRLSINPASCVSQTEARFIRWGLVSMLAAKFIPGFSVVAPPIAGALRMSLPGFLLAAAAGAALWAGSALGAGWLLREAVPEALKSLDHHMRVVLLGAILALACWLGWKLWRKHQFRKSGAVPHITAGELLEAMRGDEPPLLLDLRGATMLAQTDPIPGAITTDHDHLDEAVAGWPKTRLIVTLCACPEDAGAIQAARRLVERGFESVRPVSGGYEAWLAASARGTLKAAGPA